MKTSILKIIVASAIVSIAGSCNSTNRLINKNQETVFTSEQIKEKLAKVETGADFPGLAMDLKNLGVTYYETKMEDGCSVYHGPDGYELLTGPNYKPIPVADIVNLEQLQLDIANHQKGYSDYFGISSQCAANGIEKWLVCLESMTCTYVDKKGTKVWVERIPDTAKETQSFTANQLKAAHSKVKSGADFPAYIKEIKALGVTHYETYVADGHIDYHGGDNYTIIIPAKYEPLPIADFPQTDEFKAELAAHQQGKTDFLTFIKMCAAYGIEKWSISMKRMTCTYYDKAGNMILIEDIPH